MWCIGTLTEDYRRRTYNLLALYARPLRNDEPVVCIDEKSLQLLAHSREPLPLVPGAPLKQDYEYLRKGAINLFVAVEPKAGHRVVSVTAQRGKVDFVDFVQALLTDTYAAARKVHFVLDNLNIHFRTCFEDVLGKRAASTLLRRVQFHSSDRACPMAEGLRTRSTTALNHWTALTANLRDGNVSLDNNHLENLMRPWAMGRKAWLFAGSELGGQRAAVVMSLVVSARLNVLMY